MMRSSRSACSSQWHPRLAFILAVADLKLHRMPCNSLCSPCHLLWICRWALPPSS